MSSHTTTLVVDYDDTIAVTFNRDWEHAKPNTSLISKLNELYAHGWTIHIVTARGQLSCGGDSDAADRKYRAQIESWLSAHGVLYHTLSFQKKLAAYYIDDKGITPEQFVQKFDRIDLNAGWSGASVYYDRVTDCVYKTAPNGHSAIAWYQHAKDLGYNVPFIHNIIGDTIRMDMLPEYTGSVYSVVNVIRSFSGYPALQGDADPARYVERCTRRAADYLPSSAVSKIETILTDAMKHTPYTFAHGDCSVGNIMGKNSRESDVPAFIDPINDSTLYSSWVLDISKYYASIGMFGHERVSTAEVIAHSGLDSALIRAHALGHYCRALPYAPESSRTNILNLITTQLHVLR
jgi:capsule biosynthesis phosphatase